MANSFVTFTTSWIYLIRSRPYKHERFSLDVGSSSHLPCFCFTTLESLALLCYPVSNKTTTDCDSLSCFRVLPVCQRYLLPVWIELLDSLCSLWSLRVIRLITLVLVLWQSINTHSVFLLFGIFTNEVLIWSKITLLKLEIFQRMYGLISTFAVFENYYPFRYYTQRIINSEFTNL